MRTTPLQGVRQQRQAVQEQAKLKKACEDFEAVLTNYLFKSMRQTVVKTESEGRDQSAELYEGMMDEAVANQLSHHSGLGLGKMLYQQLASMGKQKT
jgi:peptidoglycan hydrolase FlgJ